MAGISNRKFANEVTRHLKSVDSTFIEVLGRIDVLPQTINGLDSSIQSFSGSVREQREVLRSALDGLAIELNNFTNSLSLYDSTLTVMAETSDRQLALIQKTQAQWDAELKKKALLKLAVDKVEVLGDTALQVWTSLRNRGDKYAASITVALDVPLRFKFRSSGWRPYDATGLVWNLTISEIPPASPSSEVAAKTPNTEFSLDYRVVRALPTISLTYTIFHREEPFRDTLVIQIPRTK